MRFVPTLLFVFVLSAMFVVGCGNVTPTITEASLGTQVEGGKIVNKMSTFAPADRMIHLVVDVKDVVGTVPVSAKWYRVQDEDKLLFESELALDPLNTSAEFTLTNVNDWVPGNYKVVIYLNGDEKRSLNFQVQ